MNLSVRDSALAELMDDPACDPVRLRRTHDRFRAVNRAVACWGSVYRTLLRPELAAAGRPVRILDIGCGSGDVLRRLVRLAERDGFEVSGVGIDPDPRALEAARDGGAGRSIDFRTARSSDLVAAGERFDVVVSNHLLHHLDAASLAAVIADSEVLAERISAHSDIARGRIAYSAFAVAALPLAPGSFIRVDGLRSIRRSYTAAELTAALPPGWTVERPGRFRLLAVRRPGTAASR